MNKREFVVQVPENESIRLDKFIASLGLFSRSQIARRSVQVSNIRGEILKFSRRLSNGDKIIIEWDEPEISKVVPEKMNLQIIYEDDNCVVINKEQGLVVHPSFKHEHGTLVQGLLHRYKDIQNNFEGSSIRPGIVHRLDKDTSGLIIAAKNPRAMELLSREFMERRVKKTYLAISQGVPKNREGELNNPIGRFPKDRRKFQVDTKNAKDALTRYRILSRTNTHALIQVRILTGRTHQIRVHLQSIGSPVLGDTIYGTVDSLMPSASLMLHAWRLSIRLPWDKMQNFEAEMPAHLSSAIEKLGLTLG